MRAAVMRNRRLVVADISRPEPGPGEVLVKTLACGICGSDLHALRHADRFVEAARRAGSAFAMDLSRDLVMGHEFCAEIVDHGPATSRTLKPGTRVCSRPSLIRQDGPRTVGYSNDTPGGYAEYMRLTEALLLPVPDGLPTEQAALTEPMAVGLHAVAKARLEPDDVPLVIGCGPVGLAVIAALRLHGARPIVAADFSSRRRELAVALGADVVVNPAETTPWQSWREAAVWRDASRAPALPPWIAGPAVRHAHRGGRRLHGAGHDLPDARHQQGAEPPVRARLHPRRVRGHARPHRGGAHRHHAADHRPRGRRGRRGRLRGTRLARPPRQDPRRALAGLTPIAVTARSTTFAALRERNYR